MLLERWRNGDNEAGELLVSRYYDRIDRFFANKVSGADAPDLVHETFAGCLNAPQRLREDNKFRS